MDEHLTIEKVRLDAAQMRTMDEVGTLAARAVEHDFGDGFPHFRGGKNGGLAYHNLHHTLYVAEWSAKMAQALGLSATAVKTANIAGKAHDLIQLKPRGIMERESAEWYEEQLRRRGLPEAVAHAGSLAIIGTEPILDGKNRVTGQVVSRLKFTSKVEKQIAESTASADLGEVYAPMGPYHGHRYWQEIKQVAPKDPFPMEGVLGYQENQVYLVRNYRFPNPKGERVFGRLRGRVIEHQEKVLEQLKSGQIETGEQLLAADLAFARRNA